MKNHLSEDRKYRLNIPQMLWGSVSENWFLKELGDIHWKLISEGLNQESDKLTDSNGNRLYASFVRIKWDADKSLGTFNENEEIHLNAKLSKYGNKMFFSNGKVTGDDKNITTELMSVFSSRSAGNNEKLIKGAPLIKEGHTITVHKKLPPFAKDFFKVKSQFFQADENQKQDHEETIQLYNTSFVLEADTEPVFSKIYTIDSYDDINGVGLLYFASYPKISDKCELFFFNENYIGANESFNWAEYSFSIARDIHYYGNANANEELVYNLDKFTFIDELTIKLSSSLYRKKDGALIAKIFTIKKLIEALPLKSTSLKDNLPAKKDASHAKIDAYQDTQEAPVVSNLVEQPGHGLQNIKTNASLNTQQLNTIIIGFLSDMLENKQLTIHTDLRKVGVESIVYIELSEFLNLEFGLHSNPSAFYGLFSVNEITSFLLSGHEVTHISKTENKAQEDTPQNIEANQGDIAIIGVSLKVPGAKSKEEFWNHLVEGNSCISETPLERWDWPEEISLHKEHSGINYGGYIKDIDKFDAQFFEVSPREARFMDPQQRILLELTWELLENSGYKPSALKGSKSGVFIGASGSDYETMLLKNPEVKKLSATGTASAMLANRISYFYDLEGPSLTLDTACSSSLVAINNAVNSLKQKECDQAIVGGIHLMCDPSKSIAYSESNMLSPDGKCFTFDNRANGYVRGEGAIMMLLKPVNKAIAANDNILACIKSTAVNHGGYSGGVTVPNPNKQKQLIENAYTNAKISIHDVSYIEAHGTGTSLGDPIEILGLTNAFRSLEGKTACSN